MWLAVHSQLLKGHVNTYSMLHKLMPRVFKEPSLMCMLKGELQESGAHEVYRRCSVGWTSFGGGALHHSCNSGFIGDQASLNSYDTCYLYDLSLSQADEVAFLPTLASCNKSG